MTPHSKKQVLQALVLFYPVVWSSAARKDLVKLQLASNRAARLALHCNQRDNINAMHASLSLLRVEERLTTSILLFIRNIVLKIPNCLHSQLKHCSDTDTYPIRNAPGVFSQSSNSVQYYIEPLLHGTPFSYCSNEEQTWFQKADNVTAHGTTPLPNLTKIVCVYVCYVSLFKCM